MVKQQAPMRALSGPTVARLIPLLALAACAATQAPAPPPPPNRIPIVFTTPGDAETGEIGGMVIPVRHDGKEAFLAIDTGSALSFLYLGEGGPEFVAQAGTVEIGSETFKLPGRNLAAEDETGAGIIGVLGASFFMEVPTVFDPVAASITRYPGGTQPPDSHGYTTISYEDIEGHVIVTLPADGVPLRLLWDTGCPHLLWIGVEGEPGDSRSTAQDIEGERFDIYEGTASIVLGAEGSRDIVTLRAPRFPYFEGIAEALGGNIQGLAGQSVFGRRRMMFDPAAHVIHLGPG
ncbi:MAG: hypothetical protein AB1486_24800 [Planctomycetota bacterium]